MPVRAAGAIWSPADEKPDLLAERMRNAAEHGATQALDPQLYVAQLDDANPKRLLDHELFEIPLRNFSARNLAAMVERVLEYQVDLEVTHLISPTFSVSSVSDRSAQIALNLAETTIDIVAEREKDGEELPPLLLSTAIERPVLADKDSVNALLDELTKHDVLGHYLLFEIDPDSDGSRQAALLAEALYAVYTLSVVQGRNVWVGYAGLSGYLYRAVGANAFAAGWFQKQQWWSPAHWSGAGGGGGKPPRPRIFLDCLLGSLLVETELANVRSQRIDADLADDLLSGCGALAEAFRTGSSTEPDRAECAAQLLEVCSELDGRIGDDTQASLELIETDLAEARTLYERIDDAGVTLEGRSSDTQLSVWEEALAQFRKRAMLDE